MIKKLKILNDLNDIEKQKYICVKYPGYFADHQKALEVIGGCKAITKCIEKSEPIYLKFRPEDPLAIPLKTETSPSCGLILKFIRRKIAGNTISEIEVVGMVKKSIVFDKLADFQIKSDPVFSCAVSSIFGSEYLLAPQKLSLAPKEFSRRCTPHESLLDVSRIDFSKILDDQVLSLTGSTDYFKGQKFEPNRSDIRPYYIEHNMEKFNEIVKIFNNRPLCTREYIKHHMSSTVSYHVLKGMLPCIAYYIGSGPFKFLWCYRGVDPTSNKSFAIYQTLELEPNVCSKVDKNTSGGYILHPTNAFFNRSYQYCDINMDSIQKILKDSVSDYYNQDGNGWYSNLTKSSIREIIRTEIRQFRKDTKREDI